MIDAVIFDLDETLTDRSASMARYAARFHRDLSGQLGFSPRYLKIAGRWRDHERWALVAEDWRRRRSSDAGIRRH